MSTPNLAADRSEVSQFVADLFRYADPGTWASLRAFDQADRTVPPLVIRAVKINGDLRGLSDAASAVIDRIADASSPAVFAPPIATFSNAKRARQQDIANGLTISVELDEGDARASLQRLEGLLNPATVVMESGGEWIDQQTGAIHNKLHGHWRLSQPTQDDSDHQILAHARRMAATLVGADPTGAPVAHPYRWAGSWNLKSKPRLAHIVARNPDAEVHLVDAVDALEVAVEQAGLTQHAGIPRGSGVWQAPLDILQSAVQAIPNKNEHYNAWVRIGYAIWAATGGSPDGFAMWEEWSKKSAKYNAGETDAAWRRIGGAKPNKIGAGTIFFEAKQNGWTRPAQSIAKPAILVIVGERHAAADAGIAALHGAAIYCRGPSIVRCTNLQGKTSQGTVTSTPGIIPVCQAYLERELSIAADWFRPKKDGRRPIDPPAAVSAQILAMQGLWPFPLLTGVIGTPTMRPDGSLLLAEGYDEQTGYFLLSPPKMPNIIDRPTKDQANGRWISSTISSSNSRSSMMLAAPSLSRWS